jgi:hypothetical protein
MRIAHRQFRPRQRSAPQEIVSMGGRKLRLASLAGLEAG